MTNPAGTIYISVPNSKLWGRVPLLWFTRMRAILPNTMWSGSDRWQWCISDCHMTLPTLKIHFRHSAICSRHNTNTKCLFTPRATENIL